MATRPCSSTEVRGLVIHDIKEVEGVRQQEEQGDKRDEEIEDEVNGEVEEVTQHTHETWRGRWGEQGTNLSQNVCAIVKEGSQRTTTLTDSKKRDYENEGSSMHEDSCIVINCAHAHVFSKSFR